MYYPAYLEINYTTLSVIMFMKPQQNQVFFPFKSRNTIFANFYRSN